VTHPPARGFTLVEVLVALMIVAMGLAALMTAVSGTATASGYLRDKAQAQWIALNRIVEVRMTVQKSAGTSDTGELDYANRHWHYDTRYFETSITTMRRVVVRVWSGTASAKGNPVAEATGFIGTALSTPGGSNIDWTQGSTAGGSATTGTTNTMGTTNTTGAPIAPGSTGVTTPTTVSPKPTPTP
jgi:general secretion pathway protein I